MTAHKIRIRTPSFSLICVEFELRNNGKSNGHVHTKVEKAVFQKGRQKKKIFLYQEKPRKETVASECGESRNMGTSRRNLPKHIQ